MAKVWINPLSPSTVTATSAAAGYPATNILTTNILKPWRATTLGASNFIVDLGSSQFVDTIGLQDINFVGTVTADNNPNPTTACGAFFVGIDGENRAKCTVSIAASVRYIKVAMIVGTQLDNDTAWRCGAFYAFPTSFTFPRDPLYGNSFVDYSKPQTREDLPNGQVIRDNTGAPFALINLDHSGVATDDLEQVAEYARAGLIWLFTGVFALQFPVRFNETKVTRKLSGYNRELVSFLLKEEV